MDPFIGEIKMVGFSFAPVGYAFCNADLLSIQQNAALFALLGVTFGGNGTTNFQLPDFRGRVPLGMGNGPGLTPVVQGEVSGTENVTLLPTQIPQHSHTVAVPATAGVAESQTPSPTGFLAMTADTARGGSTTVGTYASSGTAETTLLPFKSGVSGGNQPLPIRNPSLGTNFIIALNGTFPSRN